MQASPPRVLPAGRLVLGREPGEGGWTLPEDALLSRAHAALERRGETLSFKDLDSSNGSTVNGAPAREARLEDGDLLRLGDSFLLVRRSRRGARRVEAQGALSALKGDAPAMHAVRRELALAGPVEAPVLLLGETGVGKSLAARVLHGLSGRGGALVEVNCAAVPAELTEAAFFGHLKGAYTGAERAGEGYFAAADGGTLFMDELGELSPAQQAKLLLAVEARQVIPVGSVKARPVDFRLVGATSRDLRAEVDGGRFRPELYARLAEFVVQLAPLRERREDLLPLLVEALGPGHPPLDPELVERLLLHPWPYNVRELLSLARQLSLRGAGAESLGLELVGERLSQAPAPAAGPLSGEGIEDALRATGGQVKEAAARLGRSRRQLYRDMQRLGVNPEDFRR